MFHEPRNACSKLKHWLWSKRASNIEIRKDIGHIQQDHCLRKLRTFDNRSREQVLDLGIGRLDMIKGRTHQDMSDVQSQSKMSEGQVVSLGDPTFWME